MSPERVASILEKYRGGRVTVHRKSFCYTGTFQEAELSGRAFVVSYDGAQSANVGLSAGPGKTKWSELPGMQHENLPLDVRIVEESERLSFLLGEQGIISIVPPDSFEELSYSDRSA